MCFLLYFTYANAIFLRHEIRHEKMRFAFCIVFYNSKRDRKKSKTQISSTKRKRVETLAPVHQSNVSHLEGAQSWRGNYKIS